MAIDPSISLQVKQPEMPSWMDYARLNMQQQQLAMQQQNQQAALPGLQAQSQQAVFQAQKQADIKKLVADNTDTTVNEDGTTTTTVNMPKAIDAVAKAGYLQDAQSLYANHFANASASTANETSAKALRDSLFDTTSNLRQTMNNAQPGSGDTFAAKAFGNLHNVPALQKIIGDDPRFQVKGASAPTTVSSGGGPTGQIDQTTGVATLNPVTTTMTEHPGVPAIPAQAAVEAQLLPSQQGTVAAAMPTSPLSVRTAQALKEYNVPGGTGLPANQSTQLPGAPQQVQAAIIPMEAKLQAAKENPVLAGFQANATSGINNANSILQDRSVLEKISPTDPIAVVAGKLAGDGRVIGLMRAITAANNDPNNPAKIDVNHVNIADAIEALNTWNRNVGQRVLTNQEILKNSNVAGVSTPSPAPGTGGQPAPAAPTPEQQKINAERADAQKAIKNGKPESAVRALFKQRTGQDL